MTPKEKAEQLVFKYEQYKWINHDLAKQCALLAVDEILNETVPSDFFSPHRYSQQINYWREVKTEIEKL